jgi:alkanesulfonate monooxygenase SsuD/methylene tetrahydromethanopterin reductase-like flavin-dependent oxidoreductase (luciferase family)
MKFGLFLNGGEFPDLHSHSEILDSVAAYTEAAERLGYHDVWLSEHHFIQFGVCPSALTMAAFLLGRTQRLRVGTAVTLVHLYHPLQLAEQVALLDQVSGGRLDFGIGRGGYLKEVEVFGVNRARWSHELEASLDVLLDAWTQETVVSENPLFPFAATTLYPRPLTRPHPPLFLATSTPATIDRAAREGLPLQLYWGMDTDARVKVLDAYRDAAERHGRDPGAVEHVVAALALVADDEEEAMRTLRANLRWSFEAGNHPQVPQAAGRHVAADGQPLSRDTLAERVAAASIAGPPERCIERLDELIARTGATRVSLMVEAAADRTRTLDNIARLADEVLPRLTQSRAAAAPR